MGGVAAIGKKAGGAARGDSATGGAAASVDTIGGAARGDAVMGGVASSGEKETGGVEETEGCISGGILSRRRTDGTVAAGASGTTGPGSSRARARAIAARSA